MGDLDAKVALYLRAKDAYYNSCPIMSDMEFDDLEREIEAAAPDHPALAIVGAPIRAGRVVPHLVPMLSMEKALDVSTLQAWLASRAKEVGTDAFVATPKFDGMSCELRYEAGILRQAVSRGDGEQGQDITAKVRHVAPTVLSKPFTGAVRGELVLTFENFEKLNATLPEPLANTRNGVVGLINEEQLLPEKLCFIRFLAFEAVADDRPDDYSRELRWLQELGFQVPSACLLDCAAALEAVAWFEAERAEARVTDTVWDGVVFRVRSNSAGDTLGRTSKFWKRALAWKFAPDVAIVTVEKIEWSLGTRELSPVVVFSPVTLDGAIIRRAGGKSVRNLIDIGAIPGNKVELRRSGSVIPWLQRFNPPTE